ncbi:pyridine nucleotide-disulfide oxidoreductase [Marinobacterium zhoushanense]|uniref:Pyridine nucleotide-disulfide oxidoreductase n=1 Tax=Marinobacterium zhoushanense TaxID=1679163 RepID=A0ABQ1K421_9GAMM|nr:FAD-dependent oxidoreductase [Marinobacterium zhoushanense]GGB87511.1 pyridine nucleotide-disulfide oxidoreductase [Marinobacterium zhoushanense]
MSNKRHLVIVGTGVAGCSAALSARASDSEVEITLIGEEPHLPYDRTHLSKQQLASDADWDSALLIPGVTFKQKGIELRTGVRVTAIEHDTHRLILENKEELRYDKLILATGSIVRPIPSTWGPINHDDLHCIRVAEDAARLRSAFASAKKIVVIGSGLIGLEVAAAARERGIDVTVIGTGSRILMRSCDVLTAERLESVHRDRGVNFRLGISVDKIRKMDSGELEVSLTDGSVLLADDVVVGIGVLPNTTLAESAGLEVNNGISVDAYGQTSCQDIFAAGEVASFKASDSPLPFRLESWRHAQDHGDVVGANAVSHEMRVYEKPSSFWSDQFDHRIQGVGAIPDTPHDVFVRSYDNGTHISFCIGTDQKLLAVVGFDCSKDVNAAGRLVGCPINDPALMLADKSQPLGPIVKSILKSMKQEDSRHD